MCAWESETPLADTAKAAPASHTHTGGLLALSQVFCAFLGTGPAAPGQKLGPASCPRSRLAGWGNEGSRVSPCCISHQCCPCHQRLPAPSRFHLACGDRCGIPERHGDRQGLPALLRPLHSCGQSAGRAGVFPDALALEAGVQGSCWENESA